MGAIKHITVTEENGVATGATVDMGKPVLKSKDIPVVCNSENCINEEITLADRKFNMTCVSMGNPHAVMFINEHPIDFDLEKYGKIAESDTEIFPDRVNAEFAKVIDRRTIEMRVFERGAGETLACGTGTCATAVACILNGKTEDEVTITLLGGDLIIRWDREKNVIYMTGPARVVFDGEIDVTAL